jgi:hypothetical protein
MNEQQAESLIKLLEEIRDNQRIQLERQAESLSMQKTQYDRVDKIHDRAERIQDKSAMLVEGSRKLQKVFFPILVMLFVFLLWRIFFPDTSCDY